MGLFIVEGHSFGYGESNYYAVEATSMEQAEQKIKNKQGPYAEAKKNITKGTYLPCEVIMGEDGISQILTHVW